MNTSACLMFLLAIGLSTQQAEFEREFEHMVKGMILPNNTTLLNCPENCDEIKEPACKCIDFSERLNSKEHEFIEAGLSKLGLLCLKKTQSTCRILRRLRTQNKTIDEQEEWKTPKSPKVFLKYIQDTLQKIAASG